MSAECSIRDCEPRTRLLICHDRIEQESSRVADFRLDDAKARIKQATDIVDLVNTYVPLRREGRNYKGICPWHDDSRPSLQVNPERQTFRCWVCNLGGDAFTFIQLIEKVEFPEALALLSTRTGIPLAGFSRDSGDSADQKQRMFEALAWADSMFHHCLKEGTNAAVARKYLQEREISADQIERFHLGFAPAQWDFLARLADPVKRPSALLESVGLVQPRKSGEGFYDRFRGRVIFPIRDLQGRTVAFGGRVLPELATETDAKYVNSPETLLFNKSSMVFGLDLARLGIGRAKSVLVMEGYTDCIMAHQFGFTNAVAVLGTAFGKRHLQLLKRHADTIILVLDGDEAGKRRTEEVLSLFVEEEVDLRVITLPDNADPCEYLQSHGTNAFKILMDNAPDALEHLFLLATSEVDPSRDSHAAQQASEKILAMLAKSNLANSSAGSMAVKHDQIVVRTSRKLGIPEQRLRVRLKELRIKLNSRPGSNRESTRADAGTMTSPLARKLTLAQWELLDILVQVPSWIGRAAGVLTNEAFTHPECRLLFDTLVRIDEEQRPQDFESLMLGIDDPQLAALVVGLDEGHRVADRSRLDLEAELGNLIAVLNPSLAQQDLPKTNIETTRNDDGERERLERLIALERRRQGIMSPKEGT